MQRRGPFTRRTLIVASLSFLSVLAFWAPNAVADRTTALVSAGQINGNGAFDAEWGGVSEDEAAQWAEFDRVLSAMSSEELHAFVREMNWDGGGADRLNRVLMHPRCDRGTARQTS